MSLNMLHALVFLINIVFSLYILCIMLRFFLQWVKADFYNPLCQFLIKVTNPLLVPMRRVIPGWFGLDIAAVVLMIILETCNVLLLALITYFPFSEFLLVVIGVKLIKLVLNMYFFAILIRVIMSWITFAAHNPFYVPLIKLTEPLLRPVRRVIPTMGGFDLSPLIVLIVLQFMLIMFSGVVGI